MLPVIIFVSRKWERVYQHTGTTPWMFPIKTEGKWCYLVRDVLVRKFWHNATSDHSKIIRMIVNMSLDERKLLNHWEWHHDLAVENAGIFHSMGRIGAGNLDGLGCDRDQSYFRGVIACLMYRSANPPATWALWPRRSIVFISACSLCTCVQ